MSGYQRELAKAIEKRRAIVVTGCGVSMAASGNAEAASWSGLLELGLDRAVERSGRVEVRYAVEAVLSSENSKRFVQAARLIEDELGEEFAPWIRETIGGLEVVDCTVLDALVSLGAPILTTNFDTLLEDACQLASATWDDHGLMHQIITREYRAVGHLHGVHREPSSVVFGRTYDDLVRNSISQLLQQVAGLTSSLVFVGVGGAADDPNIGALLAWLGTAAKWNGRRHYWLCTEEERDARGDRLGVLAPVVYGAHHELAAFLEELAPAGDADAPPGITRHASPRHASPRQRPLVAAVEPPSAAVPSPPSSSMAVSGAWAAVSTDSRIVVVRGDRNVVSRRDGATAVAPLASFCDGPVADIAVVPTGVYLTVMDGAGFRVWTVLADASLVPWPSPFEFATAGTRIAAVDVVAPRVPAVVVALVGASDEMVQLETTGRVAPASTTLEVYPLRDHAVGHGLSLTAVYVGGAIEVTRVADDVTERRRIVVGDRDPDRVAVARPAGGRGEPVAVLAQVGGRLDMWRWADLDSAPPVNRAIEVVR